MIVRIYLITNRANEKYYVGQTSYSIDKRFKDHSSQSKSTRSRGCPILHRAIRKYGIEAFEIQELSSANSSESADSLEKLWIVALDSRNPEVGYNLSVGGNSTRGIRWSQESKAAHSLRMLGNTNGSVPCSEEKKEKIKKSLMGHTMSEETRNKIRTKRALQINVKGRRGPRGPQKNPRRRAHAA